MKIKWWITEEGIIVIEKIEPNGKEGTNGEQEYEKVDDGGGDNRGDIPDTRSPSPDS